MYSLKLKFYENTTIDKVIVNIIPRINYIVLSNQILYINRYYKKCQYTQQQYVLNFKIVITFNNEKIFNYNQWDILN